MASLFKKKKEDKDKSSPGGNVHHQNPNPGNGNFANNNNNNGGYYDNNPNNATNHHNGGHHNGNNNQYPSQQQQVYQGMASPTAAGFNQQQISPYQQGINGDSNVSPLHIASPNHMLNGPLSPTGPLPPPGPSSMMAAAAGGPGSTPPHPQLFWTQRRILGTNPFPKFQHTSSITSTGTDIFLFGGAQRGVAKGDLFVIDSESLQCQLIAPSSADHPGPKSGHTAVNIGQYIIYFGGWDSVTGICDDSLHVLHTARREWNRPPIQGPLPTPRQSHSGCSVGTTMYIFGGQFGETYLNDMVSFDMKSITQSPHWEKIEPRSELPPARSGHCAAAFGGNIYIFGGADADYFYNDIWCFDTRQSTWTPIPASGFLPPGRHGHACTISDGTMYIFGGSSPDGTELNDAYAFKINERRWYLFQNVGPAVSPRSGHSVCTIKDRIFVLGGEVAPAHKGDDSAAIHYVELSKIRYPEPPSAIIPPRQASSAKLVPNRPGPPPSADSGFANGNGVQPPGVGAGGQQGVNSSNNDLLNAPGAPRDNQISPTYDSDRSAGGNSPVGGAGPVRPDRPDRRHTQRPASPATFGMGDRQGSSNNLTISQQTQQLMNPQLAGRPLTTMGPPPPRMRDLSNGAMDDVQQMSGPPSGGAQSQQQLNAARRQTMKEDVQGPPAGSMNNNKAVPGGPNQNRRTFHQDGQQTLTPSRNGSLPPAQQQQQNGNGPQRPFPPSNGSGLGDTSPTMDRFPMAGGGPMNGGPGKADRRTMNLNMNDLNSNGSLAPGTPTGMLSPRNQSLSDQEEVNPYATSATTNYVPPPPPPGAAAAASIAAPPPKSAQPSVMANLPPPPTTPSPPVSAQIPYPPSVTDNTKKGPMTGPQIPNVNQNRGNHNNSSSNINREMHTPSPGPNSPMMSGPPNRAAPTPPPPSGNSPSAFPTVDKHGSGSSLSSLSRQALPQPPSHSAADEVKFREAESKLLKLQEENRQLQESMAQRDQDLADMKTRENWLMTKAMLAKRHSGDRTMVSSRQSQNDQDEGDEKMADLEYSLENGQLEGDQFKITMALVKVKDELKQAKMSIATQAQAASYKIKEAERVRTGALQEAAYLKAKLASLSSSPSGNGSNLSAAAVEGLAKIEMDRAADLEKRLTAALNDLEQVETRLTESQNLLIQERANRESAEERSNDTAALAAEAQMAHTRALTELATLHTRAAGAETESREYAAKLAETMAGFSGHQSQSSGLMTKVTSLKKDLEQTQQALEKTQKAYSIANDRAMRAEKQWEGSSERIEELETNQSRLTQDLNRFKADADRFQLKAEDMTNRWQIAKDEVATLRQLVEEGLGELSSPLKARHLSKDRKHDSMAILSNVSRVSELEHELQSLKVLHKTSQQAASRSANELAEAMIELSRLEQASMKARAETLSLQRMLSQERDGCVTLNAQLSKTELELEEKVKELEANEVQLGLLKDIMREKGLIAEDMMKQALARSTGEYQQTMDQKVTEAQQHALALEQELEESREHFAKEMEMLEAQRQATVNHSEKVGGMLRKLKTELESSHTERDRLQSELKQLEQSQAQLSKSSSHKNSQDEERLTMLKLHWDSERQELTGQIKTLQDRVVDSELHAAELSQKVITVTERLQEVETLNETISEEFEALQDQFENHKVKAAALKVQLEADITKLKKQVVELDTSMEAAVIMAQEKQKELEECLELNEQLGTQLDKALDAVSQPQGPTAAEQLLKKEQQGWKIQKEKLEKQLKNATESIQILEGDNSVLEARLQDSQNKISLLLENLQNSTDMSNPNSPLNSTNLAGLTHQLHQLANEAQEAANTNGHHHNNNNNNGNSNGTGDNNNDSTKNRSYRDSIDSITHELEMLKVPWNKTVLAEPKKSNSTGSQNSVTGSGGVSTSAATAGTGFKYTHNNNSVHNMNYNTQHNMNDQVEDLQYDYSDDDEDDYLAASAQQQQHRYGGGNNNNQYSYNNTNANNNGHVQDTHSLNDRSPSKLKEYEQMIEEMERNQSR